MKRFPIDSKDLSTSLRFGRDKKGRNEEILIYKEEK